MAAIDSGGERPLFVRKATGLVRGWSMFDAGIYAFYSCNVIVGLWVLSFGPFIPNGSLFWAAIIAAAFLVFEVVCYAGLIAAMPRAGGDYVWQSRILHSSIGFVLAVTGWWFILWHWVPIYANITTISVFQPLAKIVGADGLAGWLVGKDGIFSVSLLVIGVTWAYISLGMRGYAKVQRWSFWGGLVGVVTVVLLMLIRSRDSFQGAFDREATDLYGAAPGAYDATLANSGYDAPGPLHFDGKAVFLMIGFITFFMLYPNWGATLAGEVRGAGDMKKNIKAMGGALLGVLVFTLIMIGVIAKSFGWDFYNAVNNGYWGDIYAYNPEPSPLGAYPYPFMMGSWLVDSPIVQFILITLIGLWVIGWFGTVFLSSTRVIFAAAFDRILPEWAAHISPKLRVPTAALLLMVVPAVPIAALYAYWSSFAQYTYDAALVIAVTYLGTAFAAMIMPWRMKRVYQASPMAQWKLGPIPVISIAGFVTFGFLAFLLAIWLKDDIYGVNNKNSLIYMGILYGIAIGIYVIARVVRARQGMSLDQVTKEIPSE